MSPCRALRDKLFFQKFYIRNQYVLILKRQTVKALHFRRNLYCSKMDEIHHYYEEVGSSCDNYYEINKDQRSRRRQIAFKILVPSGILAVFLVIIVGTATFTIESDGVEGKFRRELLGKVTPQLKIKVEEEFTLMIHDVLIDWIAATSS